VTALANSPVFWIGLLAGLRGIARLIAVVRRVENIAVVAFLNVCRLPGQPRLSLLA
jgi:hypothetical protein